MKRSLIVVALLATLVMSFESCVVERHGPPRHHRYHRHYYR